MVAGMYKQALPNSVYLDKCADKYSSKLNDDFFGCKTRLIKGMISYRVVYKIP